VQVKANAINRAYWLIGREGREIHSPSHVYVFVTLSSKGRPPRFFVVPSKTVVKEAIGNNWHRFERNQAEPYEGRWELFDRPK
jgi:RNase P protein component